MGFDNKNITFTTPLLYRNSSFWKNHSTLSNGIRFEPNEFINHGEQHIENKRLSWRDLYPQILASVVAFLLVTQPGINMVYTNIFLNHYEFTDVSELSWLTSILVFCTPIGTIAIGVIMDRVGRKNAFLLTCMPLLISWAIASVARPEDMTLIYACRFFAGIGGGMTSMVVIYVSEIAHTSYRQVLLSLNSVFFSVGVLFATSVGSLFRWQAVNIIFFIFTAITTVLLVVFLPESPVWLAKFRANRIYDARSSLKRIYPINDQVFVEEWDRLDYVRQPDLTDAKFDGHLDGESPSCQKRRSRVRRFWRHWRSRLWWSPQPPTVTRPVRVLAIVFLLQQLSGCYPVIFYAVPVIRTVMGTTTITAFIDGDGGQPTQMDTLITLGVVRLLTSVVACALSPHVGRRQLLIASSVAMACSATLVALTCPSSAAFAEYDDYGTTTAGPRMPLLPLVGITAFVCSGSAGVIVFPWTLVGELLPVSARAVAGALLVAYAYALMFVVLRAFPYVVTLDVGGGGGGGGGDGSVAVAFAAFAVVSMTLAVYAYACLPETLGRQFQEIEQYFADDVPKTSAADGKAGRSRGGGAAAQTIL